MGVGWSKKGCFTNLEVGVQAPNPSPSNYTVRKVIHFTNTTYMQVKYHNCTNFEGDKIMVYLGKVLPEGELDPHFQENGKGPLARFEPTVEGIYAAKTFAEHY